MRRPKMTVRQRFRLFRSLALLVGLGLLLGWIVASRLNHRRTPHTAAPAPHVPVNLYLRDSGGMVLVPVTRLLPGSTGAAALDSPAARADEGGDRLFSLLQELLGSYPDKGLYAPLPAGSRIVSADLLGDQANVKIQLPKQAALGTRAEFLLAGAVVSTLTDLSDIHSVRLSLVGPQGPLQNRLHLDFSQPLTRQAWLNFGYTAGDVISETSTDNHVCTVYWRLPNAGYLVPVAVPVSDRPSLETCLGVLAHGPDLARRGYVEASLPQGWQLTLLERPATPEQAAVVEVALPSGLSWDQSAPLAYLRTVIPAVVLTLTELPDVPAVRVQTRGGTPTGQFGGYNVDQSLRRPKIINRL